MKKKKVLIDLYSLENPYCGFGQIAVNYAKLFTQVQRSGKEDFDIAFLLPYSFYKNHYDLSDYEGIECFFDETKLHHMFHVIPNRPPKVDLWHSINQLCQYYPNRHSTKHIFTIHDYNFLFEDSEEEKLRKLKAMQHRINKADAITFISKFTEQQVRENSCLDGKLTRVIYNGVERLTDVSQKRPDFVVSEKPFFFAIGQFFAKKKFDVLLNMMKFFPDTELYICGQEGSGYRQEILERIHNEHLFNVHAPGSISGEERAWLFAHCQAYMFPSIGEGFGLPAIEAMQFGKPVFASGYQSLPEIVGGHGYIWPSFQTETMARVVKEGLTEFYSSDDKAQQVKEYAASFSYQRHIEKYLKLYRELL